MEDERMDAFAKGEHYGNNFMYAGLFYSYHQEHMDSIANLFYKLIRKEDVKVAFEEFLSKSKPIEGKAKYSIGKPQGWLKPWNIFKNTQKASFPRFAPNSKFKVLELKVFPSSEMGSKAGLTFLKIKGYEDVEFGKEVEWRAKKDLMDEWMRLSEDEAVREYLREVREVYDFLEESLPDSYYKPPISRIAYYLFPVELRSFEKHVIVSKASLYKRKPETRQNLWKEILEEFEATEENKRTKKDIEYALEKEKGKKLDYLEKLLEKALDQNHLDTLRKDWKEFLRKCLKGESNNLSAVFVGKVPEKNPPWVSFGTYHIPSVELELYVFAEEGFELKIDEKVYKAKDVVKILNREFSSFPYLGNAKIKLVESAKPLDELFGKNGAFRLIKGDGLEERMLKHKNSVDLLYSLAYFSARFSNLIAQINDGRFKGKFVGILILLNTEFDEDERYALWDVVSFIYDYFGVPVQTITKRSLRSILSGNKKQKDGTIKNLIISLYKDSKVLEVEFDGFDLPKEAVVYAVVEKPSPKFFYSRGKMDDKGERHYLYEVYKISIKEKRARIELEEKYFELYGMRELGIERFVEEKKNYQNTKFCFITALKESKLGELYSKLSTPEDEHKFLLIRYDELKTAYFSDKSKQDCYIIYTQEMRKIFERLGIPMEKDVAAIALKPAHPPSMEEDIYHPSLQLFFTERVGWERDNVYSERKNLFIFTVLSLSMYESESSMTPFSKLDLWTKERNYYLTISRNYKEYIFPLKSILYEMLRFVQERPDENKT
ncbi:MAG: hypothetical protein ABIL49_02970 [candidate division WOR-3 bacterium]